MADVPIQLKFFRKLELYQELKAEDKKEKGSVRLKPWKREKKILKWTAKHHYYLDSAINPDYAYGNIFKEEFDKIKRDVYKNMPEPTDEMVMHHLTLDKWVGDLSLVFGNLVQRGFMERRENGSRRPFIFTPLGLLMGQVINEVEGSLLGKIRYRFFIILTWATIFSASIITIYSAFKILRILVPKIYSYF